MATNFKNNKVRDNLVYVLVMLCGLALALVSVPAGAALWDDACYSDEIVLRIQFERSVSQVNLSINSNRASLESFVESINGILSDGGASVGVVNIEAGASPEGLSDLNDQLSIERARNVRRLILEKTSLLPSQVRIVPLSVDWDGLLDQLDTCSQPWAGAVAELITRSPLRDDAALSKSLTGFDGGAPWDWMLENLYPQLRQARSSVRLVGEQDGRRIWSSMASGSPVPRDTVVVSRRDTIYFVPSCGPADSSARTSSLPEDTDELVDALAGALAQRYWETDGSGREFVRKPVMALRSNLFVPLLNIGVEIPLSNSWSVEADYYFPWIPRGEKREKCLQLLGGYAGVRHWIGKSHRRGEQNYRSRLLGHSVAAIGAGGYYDLQWNYEGNQGWFWAAGVDYIYAMPVAGGKLHLEFDLALGFLRTYRTPYRVYYDGGFLISEAGSKMMTDWYGPLKAGVTLVVPIVRKVDKEARHE